MGHYLRPHAWGYALGVLIISLSGVLTLLVTRLWGQLGGVGASTGEEAGVESPMAMLSIDMHSLTEVGWLILLVLAVQATLSLAGAAFCQNDRGHDAGHAERRLRSDCEHADEIFDTGAWAT